MTAETKVIDGIEYEVVNTARTSASSRNDPPDCTPWCTDPGHRRALLRADQNCWSEERTIVLSLDEFAPAAHRDYEYADPHVSVYARRDHHRLPVIVTHLYREHSNQHLAADVDFQLTPGEAVELARNLIGVVEQIAGGAQ